MAEVLKTYRGPDDPSGYEGRWKLRLNRYQRDNLVWLFGLIGYGAPGVWPFTLANNGDWAGEFPQMLAKPLPNGKATYVLNEDDHANGVSVAALRERFEKDLTGRLH